MRVVVFALLLVAGVACLAVSVVAQADAVAVRFWSDGVLVLVERGIPQGMPPAEAAVRALVAGPTQPESAAGITSRIPAGTTIASLNIANGTAAVDLSSEIVTGMDEAGLQSIFEQFRATLGDFPDIRAIKLTSGGRPLYSYLPAAPQIGSPATSGGPAVSGVGLSGKKICIGPSHGRFWNGSGWYWQRSLTCGLGESVLEDTNSVRLVQFLKQYLTQDGATFTCPRQLDESDCCNSDTGYPWWKMCAQTWLHHAGVSGSIWASYSGNTGADTATARDSDDIRARPLYADSQGADIYIAHHTNAGGSGTATGTETYRDTAMEHPEYETSSYNLASAVQSSVVSTIRSTFPEEPSWADRGVKDSAGGFGEIRIPSRPAILIELAFHDDCSRDASYLVDDFFRSVAEWAIYNGICSYFGNTPTWGKYSCEYVSDTIPATMQPGQNYNVSITYRNRGVCWFTSRGFRLGAVGDSDPMATFTRVDISGEVKPGSTYTFSFTLKAPSSAGTYTTDWQMVRDGYQWFGPIVSKNVVVLGAPDTQPPTAPQNLRRSAVTTTSITLAWDASTDDVGVTGYRIYRNGAQVGTSTSTSYTDSGLTSNTLYTYEVDAYDAAPNYSARSAAFAAGTGGTWTRSNANRNCYVRSGSPDVCGSGGIAVGYSTTASLLIRRGLVQWDMTGAPSQAETLNTPDSVRVKLNQYTQVNSTTAANISLYKVNNDWDESNGTWNNVGIGAIYSGATVSCVNVGDRTWSWNGNTQGIPIANRGVYIKNDSSESSSSYSKVFDNRTNVGGTGLPPRLEIDYVDLTAPSNCSIGINGGADATSSRSVTLTLSAADTLSGMSQMQFSDDGVSYTTAEAYATSKGYTLPAGDGIKTVYARFRDAVGNWSAPVSDSITLDTVPPTISIAAPSPPTASAGPVTYEITYGGAATITLTGADVTLNKTGTADASSVVVSGSGPTTRTVTISGITGTGTLGISIAAGTAKDLANNAAPAAGPSATFDVSNSVASFGLNNKAAGDAIIGAASATYAFTVWGKVTAIDANSFYLDDGSGKPVKVIFAGHGLANGDYASARGALDVSGAQPVLTAQTVKKQN